MTGSREKDVAGHHSRVSRDIDVERVTGIEPAQSAWKAWDSKRPYGLVRGVSALRRAFGVPLLSRVIATSKAALRGRCGPPAAGAEKAVRPPLRVLRARAVDAFVAVSAARS